ncbi:MAG: hypothetical protein LW636_04695 [Planctomycetaceae bacterium]|nr:hypothetical protein [Planctomycetaceae bacterium]
MERRDARTLSRITRECRRVATRARMLRMSSSVSSLVALALVLVAAAALLDAWIRFPAPLRVAALAAIAALVWIDVRKFLLPAMRFRPSAIDVALRVERQRPELRGRLASAVDFDLAGTTSESALAARALSDAEERAAGADLAKVLRVGPTMARAGLALALCAVGAWFVVSNPGAASIALRRTLMPWTDAVWPARTSVESLVEGSVAPSGRPFALRARLSEGNPERERVRAEYRLIARGDDGAERAGEWIDVSLARQPSGDFERLVDAEGERIEFRFMTSDASTEVVSVRLVPPPSIVRATARVSPPAYARGVVVERSEDLGDGTDARAAMRDAVLRGSAVELDLVLSREVAVGERASGVRDTAEVRAGGDEEVAVVRAPLDLVVDPADARHWTVRLTAAEAARIEVTLVDADGIAQDEPAVFAFDTIEDRAPSAAIIEPETDESVVADARIPMRATARDDIELAKAGIEVATRLGKEGVESLVFEASGDVSPAVQSVETGRMLDLAALRLSAGDSVALRGYAEDRFDGMTTPREGSGDSTVGHGRVRSAPRILRIVGEEEFERQVRATLEGVRRDAMRIDERQAKARDMLERDARDPAIGESQGAVTEGAARTRESVERLLERLERNSREDGSLGELAEQALDLAQAAEARSAEASEALEEARDAASDAERAAAAAEAAKDQDEVREELEDLVALLDRNEDAWVAKRRLEALANRIRQLSRETDQAARRSGGESRDELSPEARAELDTLASRQEQAAREADQLVSELRERADSLEEADAQQSKALEQAAQAAEEGRVREEMEQAARDAEQNRLQQSKAAQDRAAEALAKAAEALDEDRKVRAEELERLFESLVDSIKRLIDATEDETLALAGVPDAGGADGEAQRESQALAWGRLSQSTRGVAADARAVGREGARPARFLDTAAAAMAGVAKACRTEPFPRADATASAESAMKSLLDALQEAEEAEQRAQERAEEEQREELLALYRGLLERQAALRAQAEKVVPADGKPMGRRETIESRRLGSVQEELRAEIAGVVEKEEDVKGSDMLIELHGQIDGALLNARESLASARPAEALPSADDAIESLATIVEALADEQKPDDDPFGEQQGGDQQGQGEGGEQPQGAVPPVAEIKMLRSLQESLAKRTRAFSEGAAALDANTKAQKIAELAARQQRIVELAEKIAQKIAGGAGGVAMPEGAPGVSPTDTQQTDPKGGGEPKP